MAPKRIDIIVPAYNEAATLGHFHTALRRAIDGLPYDFRLLFIDDGSQDETYKVLLSVADTDPRVSVLRLSRNFGQQAALTAGLDHATGDAAITMDADLQNPPESIPDLLARWEQGAEVVHAVRLGGHQGVFFKNWSSQRFYGWLNRIAEVQVVRDSADFRLLDAKVVRALQKLREHNRFLRGLVSWAGFKHAYIHYRHEARVAGHSKYGLKRMVALALVAMVGFTRLPLHLATLVGGLVSTLGLAGGLAALVAWGLGSAAPLALWIFLGFAVVSGLQLLFLGILGEYVGQLVSEVKARPLYLVAEARLSAGKSESAALATRVGDSG